mmetsp:Transcript_15720/g.17489  ORF Transcript_15720/g.17489 Transcript_15720/m.17489 type:complete len:183 (-) Transcript_15720:340-888(-)
MKSLEVCPDGCDDSLRRVDLPSGTTVCIGCGMVLGTVIDDRAEGRRGDDEVENRKRQRLSGPSRHNIAETMFGMKHLTQRMSKKTFECKSTIESMARILVLPDYLLSACLDTLYSTNIKNLSTASFATAIIYNTCRSSPYPRTVRELLKITQVPRKTFKSALNRLRNGIKKSKAKAKLLQQV